MKCPICNKNCSYVVRRPKKVKGKKSNWVRTDFRIKCLNCNYIESKERVKN